MFFPGILPGGGGAKLNIVILWGGGGGGGGAKLLRRTTPPRGVWGYALPGFFFDLGALRSHLVPSGCPQGHLWTCLISTYFWSFILIYGEQRWESEHAEG